MSRKFLQNVIGAIISIAIGLVVIPFYIRAIGAERYGVLALVWVLLGYLGVLDLGMSRSSTNALARVDGQDIYQTGRVFTTALTINTLLGFIGSLFVVLVGSRVLLSAHALSHGVSAELESVIPWIALILPLTLAAGISIGALDARERFLTSNILQITSNALGLVVPLGVAIFISPKLTTVIPTLFWTRLFSTGAMLGFNVMEFGTLGVLRFDRGAARKLLHFGGWITVTNLVGPLMTSLDQFAIGGILGVKSVAYYSVPMSAATRLQLFSTTLSRTLFPLFSRAERSEAQDAADGALITLSFLSTLIYAPVLSVLGPLFALWLGKTFATSMMQVAPILFAGAWINGLAIIPYSLIQGQGRPDLVAKVHVCEVIPYFIALWFFAHWFGIVGVALTWSLRVTADFGILWILSKMPIRSAVRLLSSLALLVLGLVANYFAPYLHWQTQFVCAATIFLAGLVSWMFQDPRAKNMFHLVQAKPRL